MRDVLYTAPEITGLCTLVYVLLSTSVTSIRGRDLLLAVLSTKDAPYPVPVITSKSMLVLQTNIRKYSIRTFLLL